MIQQLLQSVNKNTNNEQDVYLLKPKNSFIDLKTMTVLKIGNVGGANETN